MRPENNTKKMCFYKFVATLLLSLTHRTAKILQTNRLYQIKNILYRQITPCKRLIINVLQKQVKKITSNFNLLFINTLQYILQIITAKSREIGNRFATI